MENPKPATYSDLEQFAKQIIGAVDQLRDDLYSELRTVKNDLAEIKDRLGKLEKRTLEDDNTFAKEIYRLNEEIKRLSRRVKKLEISQA